MGEERMGIAVNIAHAPYQHIFKEPEKDFGRGAMCLKGPLGPPKTTHRMRKQRTAVFITKVQREKGP